MDFLRILLVLGAVGVTLALAMRARGGTFRTLCDFGLGGAASGALGLGLTLYIPAAGPLADAGPPAIFTLLFIGTPAGIFAAIACAVALRWGWRNSADGSAKPPVFAICMLGVVTVGAALLTQAYNIAPAVLSPGLLSGALYGSALAIYRRKRQRQVT